MSMQREQLLAVARSWLGTPYHHQGRVRGIGADCIGFITGVIAQASGRQVQAPIHYGRYPDPAGALAAIAASGEGTPIDPAAALPADVVYMRIARQPQHFGFVSTQGRILHCVEPAGVVEVDLSAWMRQRILYAWRLRIVEEV